MILNREYYSKHSFFRLILFLVRKIKSLLRQNFPLSSSRASISPRHPKLKGLPYLLVNEKNQLACTGCNHCQEICPSQCLHIEKNKTGEGPPESFSFEILKCMFCGLCEEVCPEDAIRLGGDTSFAGHAEQGWVWDHHYLAFRPSLNQAQGVKVGDPHPKF